MIAIVFCTESSAKEKSRFAMFMKYSLHTGAWKLNGAPVAYSDSIHSRLRRLDLFFIIRV